MSKMLPYSVVNVLRGFIDVTLDNYGIDCLLFVPTNADDLDDMGVFSRPVDIEYAEYSTQIWIEWAPNIHRLRKLGVFAEDESPMIARFASTATRLAEESGEESVSGEDVIETVDIIPRSYVKVPLQYVPDTMNTDEFELVNLQIDGMHDAVITKLWKLVPRRVRE